MKQTTPRSLKSRALQLLAQREQSRVELRRKLLVHALADARPNAGPDWRSGSGSALGSAPGRSHVAAAGDAGHGGDLSFRLGRARERTVFRTSPNGPDADRQAPNAPAGEPSDDSPADAARRVDAVLDWLDAHRFLSDERFAESRVNARSGRYGDLRIRHELKQHGVALDAEAARSLSESEGSRAWAVWERRFGAPPATSTDLARQARFLAGRGFSPDTVRQVLRRAKVLRIAPEALATDDD